MCFVRDGTDVTINEIAKNILRQWDSHLVLNFNVQTEQLWVLSRKTTLDPVVWQQVSKNYFANGPFQESYLLPVDQNNCPTITVLKNINSEDDLLFLPQNQN